MSEDKAPGADSVVFEVFASCDSECGGVANDHAVEDGHIVEQCNLVEFAGEFVACTRAEGRDESASDEAFACGARDSGVHGGAALHGDLV